MPDLNQTHDPAVRSFVQSANRPDCGFPLQNLPFGVFSRAGEIATRCGVRIGDEVLDLQLVQSGGWLGGAAEEAAAAAAGAPTLAEVMRLPRQNLSSLRDRLFELLAAAQPKASDIAQCLFPLASVTMAMPVQPPNFADFLTSSFHRLRLGASPTLDPNYMSLPIAYQSRAGSVGVYDRVVRPRVQQRVDGAVQFAPSRQLDYELELGAFVGQGNARGEPIGIEDAANHIFGYCLLNDWSARDIQAWESMPLGPFLAKNHATTVSPWVVTEEALRPFQTNAFFRGPGETPPLDYLSSDTDRAYGNLAIELEAWLLTQRMEASGDGPVRITATNARHLYWTFAQMVTHHASNGCNLMTGDLLGSGTVSGPAPESRACLAELTERGKQPLRLPNGEMRAWLEDGDTIVLRGRAAREGFAPIGFGECGATIIPSVTWPSRRPAAQP